MAAREKEPAPPEQIAQLVRALAQGELPRAFLVRGEERFFRTQAVDAIVTRARALEFELARHDALDPDFSLRALCDDLGGSPMFAAARCVLVRNAAGLVKKESGAKAEGGASASSAKGASNSKKGAGDDSPFVRAALAFLAERASPGVLVVEAESLRADSVLAKAIAAAGGTTLSLRRLWDTAPPWSPDPMRTELVLWLQARARERGVQLKPEDALYVAAATGNDLSALDGALERLARRGGQSVRAAVGWSSAASPFQVAEDLCRGDVARSISGIEALFRGGFQDRDGTRETDFNALLAVLFGALRSKLRQTLAGALVLAAGGDLASAADAAGVAGGPRQRPEFEARLAARPAREWRVMLADLAELERASRSGRRIDANDLAVLALRWGRPQVRPAATPAPRPGFARGGR